MKNTTKVSTQENVYLVTVMVFALVGSLVHTFSVVF
jgi:hypothetical protein